MTLINIEYGSLASSDTINNNFEYLEDKIAESFDSITTTISTILSNIATINSRLTDLSGEIDDSTDSLQSKLEEYKNKTKLLVNKASMIPNWGNLVQVNFDNTSYIAPAKGFILVLPAENSSGNLAVNNTTVLFKQSAQSSQLSVIPIDAGNVITSTMGISKMYFLPTADVTLDNF